MTKKILFIANPSSKTIDNLEPAIYRVSKDYKFEWKLYYTKKTDDHAVIREKIQDYNPGIVVAAGGDGTINMVATAIIDTSTELGIIPAGSANGLAYNLAIPSDFDAAMRIFLDNDAKLIDAIRLNDDKYCYHLSDIGINARIVKRFEKEGSKGMLGYGKQMVKELFSKRSVFSFKMNTLGKNKKFRAELLVIANARNFGTGAVINPAGKLDDGKFEIVIIKTYHWWNFYQLIRMLIFGRLDNLNYIKLFTTDRADIQFDSPQDMQTDGEITRGVQRLKIKIIPSALRIRYR
jgi:diacylglycerol kinase (ATP)